MSRIDTLVCTDARKTKYRFVVLTMIFLVYAINYADRTNIGAVLPFIIDEALLMEWSPPISCATVGR